MSRVGEVYQSVEEAQFACQVWQTILGLVDWDVRVSFADRDALSGQQTDADVRWELSHRRAMIRLVTPETYHSGEGTARWPIDHENSLVHELLHLHFASFDEEPGTPKGVAQEQAICAVAKALVSLRRKVLV